MLDLNLIRSDKNFVEAALEKKGCIVDLTEVIDADRDRKALKQSAEEMKAERNRVSASIPKLKKAGQPVEPVFEEMRKLGEKIAEADAKIAELDKKISDVLLALPNMPDPDLVGGGKENNAVIKVSGERPEFGFTPKNHVDLCTDLGLIDYERGVKLSGGGFWIYRGMGARLEWALLNYFVETHLKDGYEFILPPH